MRVKSASLAGPRAAFSAALSLGIASLALAGCAAHRGNAPDRSAESRSLAAPTDAAAAMIESATAMLGQPYRFGGAAPGGFDCSGLVRFAAQSAGLALPRTAKQQLGTGLHVARRAIEPGDLVFIIFGAVPLVIATIKGYLGVRARPARMSAR